MQHEQKIKSEKDSFSRELTLNIDDSSLKEEIAKFENEYKVKEQRYDLIKTNFMEFVY
ncbi:MAG: hypothetical protein LBL77_01355 [Endomicrobium sp.]|jgi:hypothetical protein|nr:hypothetical protein [Endomicrobium sp.]